ncbi:MAG: phage minor capsid protein [Bacillota bacterium]|nr:phage minor capsid protein [Bacillota bacterium]
MDDKLVQKLIEVYEKAQQELIRVIAEKEAKGNVTAYQRSLLAKVNKILADLDIEAYKLTKQIVENYYKDTIDEVVSSLLAQNVDVSQSSTFSKLHTDAILTIVKNYFSNLHDANVFVGRQIQDAVRKAGLDAVALKISTGQTVKECKKNLVNMLIDQGLNGIKDKRGRTISLEAYAATVARSTTAEVTNTATTNQLTELGYDLVKMTSHATTCPICSVYQGRVYSISGKDNRFPPLSTAFSGEHANIHPNCRHRIFPYIESLADDLEGDIQYSNRRFEVSERDKKAIDDYNKQQFEKMKLRADRNQYQRYKLAIPNDVPKNFANFRQMKNSNSNRWKKLKTLYESAVKNEII